jgi:hypothetical protein
MAQDVLYRRPMNRTTTRAVLSFLFLTAGCSGAAPGGGPATATCVVDRVPVTVACGDPGAGARIVYEYGIETCGPDQVPSGACSSGAPCSVQTTDGQVATSATSGVCP